MKFSSRHTYGKEYFYPSNKKAESFLTIFPHSSGKRKCLTKNQIDELKELGFKIKLE